MTMISPEGYLSLLAIGRIFKNCMTLHYNIFLKQIYKIYGY